MATKTEMRKDVDKSIAMTMLVDAETSSWTEEKSGEKDAKETYCLPH